MFQRDYILKIIQQFIESILRILQLQKTGEIDKFEKAVDAFSLKFFKFSIIDLEVLDEDFILDSVKNSSNYQHLRDYYVLLFMAMSDAKKDEFKSRDKLMSIALDLLNDKIISDTNLYNIIKKDIFNNVVLVTNDSEILISFYDKLFLYFLSENQAGVMEDIFFNKIDSDLDTTQLLKISNYFYSKLGALSEVELGKQNFSHDEIRKGQNDFIKLINKKAT